MRSQTLKIQFEEMNQQRIASSQAMWIFLATEALFFGTLLASYTMLRFTYPVDFKIASHAMNLAFGSVNTIVLMTSSLFMALAVRAAEAGNRAKLIQMLLVTGTLGAAFLTIKGFEYAFDFRHHSYPGPAMRIKGHPSTPPMQLFMFLYWVMTAFHALHLVIGIGAVGYLTGKAALGRFTKDYYNPVEVVGLYWHFIDVVWLFLYPALYLAGVGAGA